METLVKVANRNFFDQLSTAPDTEIPDLPFNLKIPIMFHDSKNKSFTENYLVYLPGNVAVYTINKEVVTLKTGLRYPKIFKCMFNQLTKVFISSFHYFPKNF